MRIFVTIICVYLFTGLLYIGWCLFIDGFVEFANNAIEEMNKDYKWQYGIELPRILWPFTIFVTCIILVILWPKGVYFVIKDAIRNRK